jgi:Type IV secretion system pilin/REJ domain
MWFISIIAVIYIIYAGFQVMTGWGDEEKMKKAKNIITYVIIGILIMWLAYSIVRWTTELINKTAFSQAKNSILANIIPEAQANPWIGTFSEYKNKLRIAIQSLESDFRVNGQVSNGSILNIKDLVQSAYNRLPDIGDAGTANDTARRAVDMYLDLALKNPTSSNHVSNAISKVATFIDSANISTVTGDISASPSEWNAPMTVSFRATNIKDPSWATPDSQNYTWWIRANGGQKELGRGPSLTTTFNQEGTFTVFLEVASSSRNSKWYTDVLPLSISKSIEVKPKLWEIVLMVNGVNVSNIPSLKISPSLAKMWIILDATASRAIGNGVITNTSWDFGNGNTMNYKWSPNIVERQIYSNQWTYNIKLELTANDGQKFIKEFQLIVRDPAAVISIDNDIAHVWEEVHISSISYFTNNANIEYSWQIQDDNNKKLIKSSAGNKINYTFPSIGKYIVTLTARSPNNWIDTDSRVITIESREPIINLESPKSINTEKPNVIVFNAEKSYDPDTKSKKWLTFSWKLNGEKIQRKVHMNLKPLEQIQSALQFRINMGKFQQ